MCEKRIAVNFTMEISLKADAKYCRKKLARFIFAHAHPLLISFNVQPPLLPLPITMQWQGYSHNSYRGQCSAQHCEPQFANGLVLRDYIAYKVSELTATWQNLHAMIDGAM